MAFIETDATGTTPRVTEDVVAMVAYALILVGAGLTEMYDHSFTPDEAAWILLGGAMVLTIAHAFADALGAMAVEGQREVRDVVRILRDRAPLFLTSVPFVALCALAAVDVLSARAAYRLGVGAALLALTFSAGASVRRAGASWARTTVVGAVALVLASAVMALERLT